MPCIDPSISQSPFDVARCFVGDDPILCVEPLGAGLINATYRVDTAGGSFVLQRINHKVFPVPEHIMSNLARLHELASCRPELGVRLAAPRLADDGSTFFRARDNGIWRMMEYLSPSRTLSGVQNQEQAAEIGRLLGRFHRLGSQLDPRDMQVTLPGFHHTPGYLAALDQARAQTRNAVPDQTAASTLGTGAGAEIDDALAFMESRRALVHVLENALGKGLTKVRVIHGDPKLDNLLFEQTSDRALCLIDLDTVQPGLVHHDIGDCLRSCCNQAGEATETGNSVAFDIDVCSGILEAYGEETRGLLSPVEAALIYPSIRLIPFELGLRFLTDHMRGDRYFRVTARGDNLRKALGQFALVADIERKAPLIEAIVARNFRAERSADALRGDA
ncbi:MAG: aminoglycoside phosphotransferase family protein [Thiohalocapsa sp.]